tara:strand:+ start:531 stop:953 length:423 start_codon:yes stop_codon:yes gene_type:complete
MRFHDWELRLARTFSEWQSKDFIWGSSDCCWFASACIQAMTGRNPVKDFIKINKKYQSEAQAQELMSKYEQDIIGCIVSRLGEPKKPLLAQRGDVVLIKIFDNSKITGIVDLSGRYIKAIKKTGGLANLPLKLGEKAWTI